MEVRIHFCILCWFLRISRSSEEENFDIWNNETEYAKERGEKKADYRSSEEDVASAILIAIKKLVKQEIKI